MQIKDSSLNPINLPLEDFFELERVYQVQSNCCGERKNKPLRLLLEVSQEINLWIESQGEQ